MNEFYDEIDELLHSSDVAKGDARCSTHCIVNDISAVALTLTNNMHVWVWTMGEGLERVQYMCIGV